MCQLVHNPVVYTGWINILNCPKTESQETQSEGRRQDFNIKVGPSVDADIASTEGEIKDDNPTALAKCGRGYLCDPMLYSRFRSWPQFLGF